MNIGKSSTQFFETAAELDNIVLSNKTYQETRFVRSLLRGITSALRNLPTLIAVIAEDYTENALNHENTKAKELLEVLKNLRNAETLFFTIGLSQILEIVEFHWKFSMPPISLFRPGQELIQLYLSLNHFQMIGFGRTVI